MRPNAEQDRCEDAGGCGLDLVKWANGDCWFCPEYKKLVGDRCVRRSCPQTQRLTKKGDCVDCPPNRVSTPYDCIRKYTCSGDREIYNARDECETCPDYTRPKTDKLECVPDICYSTQYLTRDGTCANCPSGKIGSFDQRTCVDPPRCGRREIFVPQTDTCMRCPDYFIPDRTGEACVEARCGPREMILPAGGCQPCELGTRPSVNQRACWFPEDAFEPPAP